MIRLHKTVTSILPANFLAVFDEANWQVGRRAVARNWGTESCQQSRKWAWRKILSQMSLQLRSLPLRSLVGDPEAEAPHKLCLDNDHRNRELINVCAFKPLSFKVICYVAICTLKTKSTMVILVWEMLYTIHFLAIAMQISFNPGLFHFGC